MSSSADKATKKLKKNQKDGDGDEIPTLTKEETAIAKFLRLSCPNKQGTLVGMKVSFFIGNKLVDCLMESKWGPGKDKDASTKSKSSQTPLFASRQACVSFMQRLMNKQLFYRAVKVYKEPSIKETNREVKDEEKSTPDVRKRVKNSSDDSTTTKTTDTPKPGSDTTPSSATPQQKEAAANKKKFKLEMHEEQKFFDTNEPFVWIYDPTSTTTYIIGALLILGSIGICLFPLWPSQVREGVYYLSLAGATFLGAILAVALIKYVLFALVFACTFGKIRFWLFPNLTEDVGFFESFVPVYKCNGCSSTSSSVNKDTEKSKSKEDTTTASIATNDSDDKTLASSSTSNTPGSSKPSKKASKVVSNELSKSTLMINSINSDSPMLRSKTNSKDGGGDDEFELLDGNEDELKKESSSDD